MTRNTPIGVVTDDSHVLAAAIRRRINSTDGPVQVWTERGEVYAQNVLTKAAKRIDKEWPEFILAIYTKMAKVPDIESDIIEMQREVVA